MRPLLWILITGFTAAAPLAKTLKQQVVAVINFGIPGQNAAYDFVIMGGGTGLALAYCLAEDSSNTVTVVEADRFYKIKNSNTLVLLVYN
jgi:choline dehydrogenase